MNGPELIGAVVIIGLLVIATTTTAAAQSTPLPPCPTPGSVGSPPPPPPPTEAPCRCAPSPPAVQPGSDECDTPTLPRTPWRTRIYFSWGYSGFTTLISGQGPFGKLKPGFNVSAWVGLRFTPRWGIEAGFSGSQHANGADDVAFEDRASLVGVNLSLRYYLAPRWRVFVPFLLAGAMFHAVSATAWSAGDTVSLNVMGGGYQVGGGFDIYIYRIFTLGMRVRYRGIFLGKPKCDAYDKPCVDPVYKKTSSARAVTGELTVGLVF